MFLASGSRNVYIRFMVKGMEIQSLKTFFPNECEQRLMIFDDFILSLAWGMRSVYQTHPIFWCI